MEKYCKSCRSVFNDLKYKLCPYCGGELDTRYGRQPIPRKLRHEVFMRDGYRCRECGASKDETSLEIDHIVPVARGGTNDIDNLQTLCRECNRMKHTDEWVGGETDLESLEKQLLQLKGILNDKESLLSQATTEEEEIIIKYDIIKLNEKIKDVEEEIKSEEKKLEDNIIKKKEAETNDFTFKWLYTSVPEEKLSLLCDLLMINNFEKMSLLTSGFFDIYTIGLKNQNTYHYSWYEKYHEKFDYLTYYIINPFKEYYECINFILDIYFERSEETFINLEEIINDSKFTIIKNHLKGIFTSQFEHELDGILKLKYNLMMANDNEIYSSLIPDYYIKRKPKEKYMQFLAEFFSLDELKEAIKEIDNYMDKLNTLSNLKDMFFYKSKYDVNNLKLRILYKELNISGYQLPFYKVKYIIDNYSLEEIESTMNHIEYITDIYKNPIKIGIENENILKFLFKELNIDEPFSSSLKFKLLIDNYSKEEINSMISYIKNILDIIYSEVENDPNSDKSLINNKYINKKFKSIKDEILELENIKRKLLEANLDDDFLSLFIDYGNLKNNDKINYLLVNYSIDDLNKIINQN